MNLYLSSLDLGKIILRTVLALLIGLVFCLFPDTSARVFVIVIGASILFVGIVAFLSIFTFKGGRPAAYNYLNLAVSLAVGIALLAKPDFFIHLLMFLLGIILALGGIGQIASLASVRKWGIKANLAEYLLGFLLLGLGIFVCFYPGFTNNTLFVLFGLGAIFYAVTNFAVLLHVRSLIRKSGKKLVNGDIEDVDYTIEN